METTRSGGSPTWKRLMTLLENHCKDILKREATAKDDLIYLYETGEYWVAFEQSACRLRQLFPGSDIIVLHLPVWPFPVVMVSVSDTVFRQYSRTHIVRDFGPGHRILSGAPVSPEQYSRWHKAALAGLI